MAHSSARREHIIYAHPPASHGYVFFYLSYMPGEDHVVLRFRRQGLEETQQVVRSPLAMLELLEEQAALRGETLADHSPWASAAQALRLQLQQWIQEM